MTDKGRGPLTPSEAARAEGWEPGIGQSPGTLAVVSAADRARMTGIQNGSRSLALATTADADRATDDMAFAQHVARALERARADGLAPLRRRLEEERAKYDGLLRPVTEAIDRIKRALLAFREEARRQAENAANARAVVAARDAAAAAESDSLAAGLSPAAAAEVAASVGGAVQAEEAKAVGFVPTAFQGDAGRASVRKVWTFEVTDHGLVPRQYLMVNPDGIREAIQLGVREIPGVRIYQKETITGTRR